MLLGFVVSILLRGFVCLMLICCLLSGCFSVDCLVYLLWVCLLDDETVFCEFTILHGFRCVIVWFCLFGNSVVFKGVSFIDLPYFFCYDNLLSSLMCLWFGCLVIWCLV